MTHDPGGSHVAELRAPELLSVVADSSARTPRAHLGTTEFTLRGRSGRA
jgi:hypothetical protein